MVDLHQAARRERGAGPRRRFREQGATSPDHAIPFADVGMRRSWVFDQMVSRGVFVEAGNSRHWIDEQAAKSFLEAQRRVFEVLDESGQVRRIPFHRVREVYRDGQRTWHRQADPT